MKFIKTNYFNLQLFELQKKYKFIFDDFESFENNFKNEPFSDL